VKAETESGSEALASAERGARWLLALVQPDGSLARGNRLSAYYKTPFALTITGHVTQAERMLDYVAARFLGSDGDLDGSGVEWYERFRIYPHAWLACAAMTRGRFEMARSLVRVLLAHHDQKTGGFFATAEGAVRRAGPQEIKTTSMAGLACLWTGRRDIALETGRWLENLYNAQPNLKRGLYQVWHSQRGLVSDFPADDAIAYFVDARRPRQWYFQYGISAAFLASLSAAHGEKRWLSLAQNYLRASRHCHEDVYRTPLSGQIGWGSAWTYRLSRDPEDCGLAREVIRGLLSMQNQDGSWVPSGAGGQPAADPEPLIDVTAEFTALQASMGLVSGV